MKVANAFPRVYRATACLPANRFYPFQAKSFQHASFATLSRVIGPQEVSPATQFQVTDPLRATEPTFVANVHQALERSGMATIKLAFADPSSSFLERLVCSFNKNHGHQLPITHSASQGWFWDVRPSDGTRIPLQTANHRARSETMADFPWHTDCSYEGSPPRYFGLHVLQHDRFGGGTLSAMNIERLGAALSPAARQALRREDFLITIPPEFIKDPARTSIRGNVMASADKATSGAAGSTSMMRYRRDLLEPLTAAAAGALRELDVLLKGSSAGESVAAASTLHLTAKDCPAGTIILMDNRRWLHARNDIKDPERHLRRIRWDAIPFPRE
ncbi:Taurine catabolism dioxygenase TauD/TfdA [Akanthomyces lecanii RCEF 1005]|uniref:Taurine catabolism dioxygenase TauD/TfdA n=1 Tax=Akanthomyces lecanii RCEF 1005 TaxID=1081108 RepID=A0A168AW78_CORDF|nr:Taurine catabolism dioxygenase TauD/TfdA [Akanthomyces lecanii RCEF 1005]